MNKIDLIIVGGGPAGLTAAKVAAEKGMKVVLVEAKTDIPKITRTCAQIFYLEHIGGGQAYTKPVQVEIASGNNLRFIFPDINFSLEYAGNLRACYDWRNLSPNGTCVYTTRNKLWGFVFDKEVLLQGLLQDIENRGVTVMRGTRGLSAGNTAGGVSVEVKDSSGETHILQARHAIIANSVNSRIVEQLGFNKERKTIGMTISVLGYIMEGIACPYPPSSWISISYPSLSSFINIWLGPMADGTWQVGTSEKVPASPVAIMDRFLADSTYAPWFKNAKIIHKTACSITPRYPIAEPVAGNIMVIGDAAAPAETWTQGAIACGYKAVQSILENDPALYVAWWKQAFHFNSPVYYEELARYPALNMFFCDEDINYLYGLLADGLVTTVLGGILSRVDAIRKEKPGIYEKLKKIPGVRLNDNQ